MQPSAGSNLSRILKPRVSISDPDGAIRLMLRKRLVWRRIDASVPYGVERSVSCLHQFRRLRIRWERRAIST